MQNHFGTTVATYTLLALAGGFSFVLPDHLASGLASAADGWKQDAPMVIAITGTRCRWSTRAARESATRALSGFLTEPSAASAFEALPVSLQREIDGWYAWSTAVLSRPHGSTDDAEVHSIIHIVDASFTHHHAAHGILEIGGFGEAWVMIDGVAVAQWVRPPQTDDGVLGISLNAMELADGSSHTLRLMMAQSCEAPGGQVRTNIPLQPLSSDS